MTELKLILATHVAFYRRHPWLMVLFLLGFSLGSALLTAISGLNQEAKSRYQKSSAQIENPVSHLIRPLAGQERFSGDIWLALKRAGVRSANPVLHGNIVTEKGENLAIKGVDTLQWLTLQHSINPAKGDEVGQGSGFSLTNLLVDRQFASRLLDTSGKWVLFALPDGVAQPSVSFADDIGYGAITDIAFADHLLKADGQLSLIELSHISDKQLADIDTLIAGKADIVQADQQAFNVLSQAFFFNLTALALLGYVVAAFLSFNAIKLTLTARKKLISQMHLLGCSRRSIQYALAIELITVSAITALLGALGGFVIANGLVMDVNKTLVSLYQLDKALVINWQWQSVLLGLALNMGAMCVILFCQKPQISKQANLGWALSLLLTLGLLVWQWGFANTEFDALLLCFAILMVFVLIVPKLLSTLLSLPVSFKHPLYIWLHADTRFHVKDLHVAIVAILVALGSAIGMQIMVKSFANTLDAHLEKQLSADIYLRTEAPNSSLRNALQNESNVSLVSIYKQSDGSIGKVPATLGSFGDSAQHYQHISLTSGEAISQRHFVDNGCLANEQSAIKFALSLGEKIEFQQGNNRFSCRISGFFYDYGNPMVSLFTLEQRHDATLMQWRFYGYAIRLQNSDSVVHFSEVLVDRYQQDSAQIMPNQTFKRYANRLFNDTFVVTKALNGFILAIALLSLCTSLLSLSANQLKQLIILKNLGVTGHQLLWLKLIQTTIVVSFTALFAIPLGFALGFALLKFVMPIAFGWTIHFHLDMATLLMTCLTLIVVSVVCAFLPIRKLTQRNETGAI